MKKTYVKPELYFESFELSENIATGCTVINKQPAEGTCGYNDGVETIFLTTISGCVHKEDSDSGTICYHIPNDTSSLFSS